jgi:hypothetical protein
VPVQEQEFVFPHFLVSCLMLPFNPDNHAISDSILAKAPSLAGQARSAALGLFRHSVFHKGS